MTPSPDPKPMIMTVVDIFQLEGRGTVLTGSILPDSSTCPEG